MPETRRRNNGSVAHLVAVTTDATRLRAAPRREHGACGASPGAGVTAAAGRSLPAGNVSLRMTKTFLCA
jgi:hypothetical protein